MFDSTKVILSLFFFLFFIQNTKQSEVGKTTEMINSLISRYGETALKSTVPCILFSACENCTTIPSCVYITTGSGGSYHSVKVTHSNGTVLETFSNKFCWSGIF